MDQVKRELEHDYGAAPAQPANYFAEPANCFAEAAAPNPATLLPKRSPVLDADELEALQDEFGKDGMVTEAEHASMAAEVQAARVGGAGVTEAEHASMAAEVQAARVGGAGVTPVPQPRPRPRPRPTALASPQCECAEGAVTVHCERCKLDCCAACDAGAHRGARSAHVRIPFRGSKSAATMAPSEKQAVLTRIGPARVASHV